MIDRGDALPLIAQARQLGISRGSIYYLPRPVSDSDLAIMRRIDELHLLYPFAGSRMLRDLLRREGTPVGRLHVATLMKRMGLEALYRRPNTSKPAPGHKIYPYLLRKLAVTRPNQVWATDITYIPMARGFVYLVAIVDWFTRRVLAWRVSISLDAGFCIEALEEALARYGKPAIFNSDQGSQFTSTAFTAVLHREQIAISMDGKGCWRQRVCGAPLALGEIRGGSTSTPMPQSPRPAPVSADISGSTMPSGRTPRLAAVRPTRYTSHSRFSQRHDQPAAVHLSKLRACSDKTSHLSPQRGHLRAIA